jgi:hypothetical protein
LISILGVYSTLRQKLYYNPTDNSVATEIDIPILGKLKTNVPALVLCFIGLVPIVLAYNEMQGREQALVKFRGKVAIDPSIVAGIKSITVGATSGQWTQSATPNSANPTVDVSIPYPIRGRPTRSMHSLTADRKRASRSSADLMTGHSI